MLSEWSFNLTIQTKKSCFLLEATITSKSCTLTMSTKKNCFLLKATINNYIRIVNKAWCAQLICAKYENGYLWLQELKGHNVLRTPNPLEHMRKDGTIGAEMPFILFYKYILEYTILYKPTIFLLSFQCETHFVYLFPIPRYLLQRQLSLFIHKFE